MEDIPGFCAAVLCPLCMLGINRMENDDPGNICICGGYAVGTYCCYPFASCIICQGYQSTKRKSSVRTDDFNDFLLSLCCPICVIAQETRMIKRRKFVHPNAQAPPQVQVMINTPQQPQQQMMVVQQQPMYQQPMMGQPQPPMYQQPMPQQPMPMGQPHPSYSQPIPTGVPVSHVVDKTV